MSFYAMLEDLENLSGSIAKEDHLEYILQHVSNAESFFRFAFNDQIFGIKEQTFKNAFNNQQFTQNHVSEWLATTNFEPMADGSSYKVPDLIKFGYNLLTLSGNNQETKLANFIRQCKPLQKKWFARAILKDLRCGVQIKTMNKVFKRLDLIPIKKFALQLCKALDIYNNTEVENKLIFPCSMECKYDGIRLQAEIFTNNEETDCRLTSRRGTDNTDKYPLVRQALIKTFAGENVILDGEIISDSFQDLTRKDSKAKKKYVLFDNITDETLKYLDRWDNLMSLCSSREVSCITELKDKEIPYSMEKHIYTAEHYNCNNIQEARIFYDELNSRKEEGIIIKNDAKRYDRGSRKNMFKCKKVYTADLLCIGYKLGEGKRTGKVSTLCLMDKSKTIRVDVGSGVDDYTSNMLTDYVKMSTKLNTLNNDEESIPYFVGKIVEIKYNEITETGSIRFPRYICFRDDKETEDDLSLTEVRQNV